MGLVTLELLETQAEIITSEEKVAFVKGGTGCGKSHSLCHWLRIRMRKFPKGRHYMIAADYSQIKRGFLVTFCSILDDVNEPYKLNKTENTITFINSGAVLTMLSAELVDKLRGLEADTVFADEVASWQNGEAVFKILMTRMRRSPDARKWHPELKPQFRGAFNPKSAGTWLWQLIEGKLHGNSKKKNIKCWTMSTRDNVLMGETELAEYIELLESTLHPSQWASEIDGEWGAAKGAAYRGFKSEIHCNPPAPIDFTLDHNKPILWGHDFNVASMSSVIMQVFRQDMLPDGYRATKLGEQQRQTYRKTIPAWQQKIFRVIDEIILNDAGIPEVVTEFISRYGTFCKDYQRRTSKPGLIIYGDASGSQRQQAASAMGPNSNWLTMFQLLSAEGIKFEVRVPKKNPPHVNRINAANSAFETKQGYGCAVNPKCVRLIQDFAQQTWMEGKFELDKRDPTIGHCSDSASYIIVTEDGIKRKTLVGQDFMAR